MANNYMFLVHRPSMTRIVLGKRMGFGWYVPHDDINAAMNRFFAECEEACAADALEQDDFALVLESAEGAPWAAGVITYGGGTEDEPGVMEIAPPTGIKSDPGI